MADLKDLKNRFEDKLRAYLEAAPELRIEAPIDIFPESEGNYGALYQDKNVFPKAISYTMITNGKRLRPLIVYTSGVAFGASLDVLDQIAICIEMSHVTSLIYDDLPCIDNDDLRHGKPSCHKAFSECAAVLTGYSMIYLSFELLSKLNIPELNRLKIISILASRLGARGLALGEFLDTETFSKASSINELEYIYYLKTAKLFAASALMGAVAGKDVNEEHLNLLEKAMLKMGIAFQIQDDLLTYEESAEVLGKDPKSDLLKEKPTIPSLIGVEAAYNIRDRLLQDCISLINSIPKDLSQLKEVLHYFGRFNRT